MYDSNNPISRFAKLRRDALAALITDLAPQCQTLLALYYQERLSLAEIAAVLDVSHARARDQLDHAISELAAAAEPIRRAARS